MGHTARTRSDHRDGAVSRAEANALGAVGADCRTLDLQDLMGGERRIVILHRDRRYALRITKQDKLILTRDDADAASGGEGGAP